jgi:hypothetical protein
MLGPQRAKVDGGFGEGTDLLKEINKIPLFMTELPEEENETLAALQSLIYDGPPEGRYSCNIIISFYYFFFSIIISLVNFI